MAYKWIYDKESNCIVSNPRGVVAYEDVIDGHCIKNEATAHRLAELENLYPENSWYKQLDILIYEGLVDDSFGGDSDPNDKAPNMYFVKEPEPTRTPGLGAFPDTDVLTGLTIKPKERKG